MIGRCLNPKSSWLKEFLRKNFLSSPILMTRNDGEKVLDLGCGWGFYFKINPRAWGVDIDEKCIIHLKKMGYKAIMGDIRQKLPFQDAFFKSIIAHDVLEHFELSEIENIIKEVGRILKRSGHFFILIPNKKGFYAPYNKINLGHKHFINFQEIINIVGKNFIVVKHCFYPFPKIIGDFFNHNKEVIILMKK